MGQGNGKGLEMRRACYLMGLWLLAGWTGVRASDCVVVRVAEAGPVQLEALKRVPGLESWVELDEELFLCGSEDAVAEASRLSPLLRRLPGLDAQRIRMTHGLHRQELLDAGLRVLAQGGRFALVELTDELADTSFFHRAHALCSQRHPGATARQRPASDPGARKHPERAVPECRIW